MVFQFVVVWFWVCFAFTVLVWVCCCLVWCGYCGWTVCVCAIVVVCVCAVGVVLGVSGVA